MNKINRWSCLFKGVGWIAGSVAGLFLVSDALELFGLRALAHKDIAEILLAHFLATWSFVLGLVGLAIIPVWLFIRAKTRCQEQAIS